MQSCLKHGLSAGCNAQIHLPAERAIDNDGQTSVVPLCRVVRAFRGGCFSFAHFIHLQACLCRSTKTRELIEEKGGLFVMISLLLRPGAVYCNGSLAFLLVETIDNISLVDEVETEGWMNRENTSPCCANSMDACSTVSSLSL